MNRTQLLEKAQEMGLPREELDEGSLKIFDRYSDDSEHQIILLRECVKQYTNPFATRGEVVEPEMDIMDWWKSNAPRDTMVYKGAFGDQLQFFAYSLSNLLKVRAATTTPRTSRREGDHVTDATPSGGGLT